MQTISNTITLLGNLGQDVNITTFDSGSKKATVSLATTEYYKNQSGDLVKNTLWHNVIAWGKNADLMVRSLCKGCKVTITGNITYRSYEDKDGVQRQHTEILVNEFKKLADAPIRVKEPAPF